MNGDWRDRGNPTISLDSPIAGEGFGDGIRLRTPRPGSLAIRRVEESMSDVERLISGRSFDSVDEMNEYLQSLVKQGRPAPKTPASTPLQAAQDMIYRAVGVSSKKRRLELARKALNISPDCADAYVILAQAGDDLDKPERGETVHESKVGAGALPVGHRAEG